MTFSITAVQLSSHLLPKVPSLKAALLIGRGGALLAASKALDSVATSENNTEHDHVLKLTHQGKAVAWMVGAMSCHYFGYALARPITVALFTSGRTGYAGFAPAFPFAMAFVSPTVLILLLGYGNLLQNYGPRWALMWSTVFCAVVVLVSALAVAILEKTDWSVLSISVVKLITGPLFVFRESYVQLLTSQYWSFISSTLDPTQSARWFSPIAGMTSIFSACAGVAVSSVVELLGLPGALLLTSMALLLSLVGASKAYSIARLHGFEPQAETVSKAGTNGSVSAGRERLIPKATKLFRRVPILRALFLEILANQGLATALNVCFVARLGTAIPDDAKRAGWVGVFFALINLITMFLQFAILPPLMTQVEPQVLWRSLPVLTVFFTAFQSLQSDPSLFLVSASLLVMKVSEYSVRRTLDELIYVPLDFDSRFLGKEVISVFGYRFGKSLMSLALSALTSLTRDKSLQPLSAMSSLVSLLWMRAAWKLGGLVPTWKEAEVVYNATHHL